MRIGITCYATFGGSGIIATELGMELARRGHEVHFICAEAPRRLDPASGIQLHLVKPPSYPLFGHLYTIALASRMVEVATEARLDLLHVHYAIPHATAGYLAKQILGAKAPKLVTTLHGTDITIVGGDPHFLPVTRLSIQQSDGVTTPSRYLADATRSQLAVETEIEVIPNFVDTDEYAPGRSSLPLIVHNSNFRALKRVDDVVRIFAEVRRSIPCQLAMIGDGPERERAQQLATDLGVASDVSFLGERRDFTETLGRARVFLLPSEIESFGLAALEAMSTGVPVVASRVGGLPEVVTEGETGFLAPVGDVAAMATAVQRLLQDDALHARMSARARAVTLERFRLAPAVDRYEAYYHRVLEG